MAPNSKRTGSFLDLIWVKALFNLKSEASSNRLSYLWWVIEPLLYMLVFYIVFAVLLKTGGDNYVAYLLTGIVPFQWFSKAVSNASDTILSARHIMQQIRISPLFFPMVSVLQATLKELPVFAMLVVFLVCYGLQPTLLWLCLVPVLIIQFLLIAATGILLAMLVPFLRDLQRIIPTGMQFVMFTSGVFFGAAQIPEQWHDIYFLNPVASLLAQYRTVIIDNLPPDWSMLVSPGVCLAVFLCIIAMLYQKFSHTYTRLVME